MAKFDNFLSTLAGSETTSFSGEVGYIVTVGELLENGGKNEFFKLISRRKSGDFSVSQNVFSGLQYDRTEKKWFADCFTDISRCSRPLSKKSLVFIGFTF